jgi:hypothetical protein
MNELHSETEAGSFATALARRTAAEMRRHVQRSIDAVAAVREFSSEPSSPSAAFYGEAARRALLGGQYDLVGEAIEGGAPTDEPPLGVMIAGLCPSLQPSEA